MTFISLARTLRTMLEPDLLDGRNNILSVVLMETTIASIAFAVFYPLDSIHSIKNRQV